MTASPYCVLTSALVFRKPRLAAATQSRPRAPDRRRLRHVSGSAPSQGAAQAENDAEAAVTRRCADRGSGACSRHMHAAGRGAAGVLRRGREWLPQHRSGCGPPQPGGIAGGCPCRVDHSGWPRTACMSCVVPYNSPRMHGSRSAAAVSVIPLPGRSTVRRGECRGECRRRSCVSLRGRVAEGRTTDDTTAAGLACLTPGHRSR